MRKVPIFPLSLRALGTISGIVLSVIFLVVFFLSPPPAEYKHVGTQTGEVTGIRIKNTKYHRGEAPIEVALDNGTVIYMKVPTSRTVIVGQSIEVDILKAEGKKPRYRLAQPTNQP